MNPVERTEHVLNMPAMHQLVIDLAKCRKSCELCEEIIPGFKTRFEGVLSISNSNVKDINIRAKINRAINNCPIDAVSLRKQDVPA
jgi:ferredoxin